jgi:hypothetical protein
MEQKNTDPNHLTARPHSTNKPIGELEPKDANIEDAKTSGYTDENGNAVSKAKPDVTGSPTGAYTDVGEGRSSVVKPHHKDANKDITDEPH